MLIPFILGITRGSTICMIACAPGIVPYLISKQYNWRKCLQLAIIFNIPRIIVLSIMGVIVGIIGFYIKELIESSLPKIFLPIQGLGYGLLGVFVFIFGAYMFTTSIETQENHKEMNQDKSSKGKKNMKGTDPKSVANTSSCTVKTRGACTHGKECSQPSCKSQRSGILSWIQTKFKTIQNKPTNLFLLWGGILSIACLGEIILIELSIISGSFGIISDTVFGAALLGGAAMFLFAIGAAIPIIVVATLSSSISRYFKSVEKIESIRTIGAIVMIMVGLIYILIAVNALIANF